jgi:hypothetical protein
VSANASSNLDADELLDQPKEEGTPQESGVWSSVLRWWASQQKQAGKWVHDPLSGLTESDDVETLTVENLTLRRLKAKLQELGAAGVVAYGVLNTAYYCAPSCFSEQGDSAMTGVYVRPSCIMHRASLTHHASCVPHASCIVRPSRIMYRASLMHHASCVPHASCIVRPSRSMHRASFEPERG